MTMALTSLSQRVNRSDRQLRRAIDNIGAMLGTRGRSLESTEMHAWLWTYLGPLLDAWSRANAYGRHQQGLTLANALVSSCMDMLRMIDGGSNDLTERIMEHTKTIRHHRLALTEHLRESLNLPMIDLINAPASRR